MLALWPRSGVSAHGEEPDHLLLVNVRFTIKVTAAVCFLATSTAYILSNSAFVFWLGSAGLICFFVTTILLESWNLFARILYLFVLNVIVACAVDSGGPTSAARLYFLAAGCLPLLCFSHKERGWAWLSILFSLVLLNMSLTWPGFVFTPKNIPSMLENIIDTNLAFMMLTVILGVALHRAREFNKGLVAREREMQNQAKLAAIGQMAGGIAHEINNPLTVVLGNTKKLARLLKESDATDQAHLRNVATTIDTIERMGVRIADIVKGMRNVSRKSDWDPLSSVPLKGILDETISLCAEQIRVNDVHFSYSCSPDLIVKCRPGEISQIVMNLLINGVDAVKNLSRKEVSVSAVAHREEVFIDVADSGQGLPAKVAENIFTPFFTTKPVGEGTGLGLSISYSLAQRNEGLLRYVDTGGRSTLFRLILKRGVLSGVTEPRSEPSS